MDRFHFLFEKYLNGEVSAPEETELVGLIKSGRYDEALKNLIDQALTNAKTTTDMPAENAKRLQDKILRTERDNARLFSISSKTRNLKFGAIAALILVVIAMGWLLSRQRVTIHRKESNISSPIKAMVEKHGKQFIRLPDGSTVLLNKNSQLNYPDSFDRNTRTVTLTGEGYFDIKTITNKPFIVQTGGIRVTVLGTAFNIKAYPNQKEVAITVTRGKVKVSSGGKDYGIATTNQQIDIHTDKHVVQHKEVNAEKTIAWKNRYLIIDDLSLEDAVLLIGNKYHVNILLADDSLKHYRISATFLNNENLKQVLTVICGVVNASFTLQPNDQVIIHSKRTQ